MRPRLLFAGLAVAGGWLLLNRKSAPVATVPAPSPTGTSGGLVSQPVSGVALPNGALHLITYQQWWEKYVNGGQPAPAYLGFPQTMVHDSPNGAQVGTTQTRLTGAVT